MADPLSPSLERADLALRHGDLHVRHGRVSNLIGLIIEATGVQAEVGELCNVQTGRHSAPVPAEVVGFRESRTLLMPLGEMHGIGPGTAVTATGQQLRVTVGRACSGASSTRSAVRSTASTSRSSGRSDPRSPSRRRRSSDRLSASASRSGCAPSTRSCPAAAVSASGSSPARASASRRCSDDCEVDRRRRERDLPRR